MRTQKIFALLKNKKYFAIFLFSSLIYLLISAYLINYFFIGFDNFFNYPQRFYPYLNILISLIISILFGINISLIFIRLKEIKSYSNESGVGIFSSAISIISAGCPVCSFSILNILIPELTVAFSLALLPFKGLEIQLFSIILLTISIYNLTKSNVCEMNQKL